MRVFVYEFVTGGGMFSVDAAQAPAGSLLSEGAAMISALVDDFARLPDVKVVTMRDRRLGDGRLPAAAISSVAGAAQERGVFAQLAAGSDWTVVIAPEFDGLLHERSCWVEAAGGRLLSPNPEFVAWASDKHQSARTLQSAGVPMPSAAIVPRHGRFPQDGQYPAVLKPRNGAGSVDVRYLQDADALGDEPMFDHDMRLEHYCPGLAASIALLCGPTTSMSLAPFRQRLSDDGTFRYLGGQLMTDENRCARAHRLARLVTSTLPAVTGYVGIDIVLGKEASGSDDVVIEINPRLTTSYVGLRAATRNNLPGAMLDIAMSRPVELQFCDRPVRFDADGTVAGPQDQESQV